MYKSEIREDVMAIGFFIVLLFIAAVIGAAISMDYWKDKGWSDAYRSMKSGTIEKEIQERAPALWIELNKEKSE